MPKAIIIGASSGIGKELAIHLSTSGYSVGITGRRQKLLEELQAQLPNLSFIKQQDVAQTTEAMQQLSELIAQMGGLDLIIINAGLGSVDPDLPWEKEKETIDVNVAGFAAMANVAYHYFVNQGSGHIVGISSIAALRGGPAPAYCASKAFVSNYLQGLRYKVVKLGLPICITDIKPGFVDTAMAKGDGIFWCAPTKKAASQICLAISRKRKHAYITKRWRMIAWAINLLPDFLYHRL